MNPIKQAVSCLFALLSLFPVQAADLKIYSDVYQKNSEEIRQSFQPKFDDLQQQYQKALEALKTRAQGQGDFKTTKAAQTETDRFQKAKSLPDTLDANEIPEIKYDMKEVKGFSKKTETGYTLEFLIPASLIKGFKADKGTKIGLNFNISVTHAKRDKFEVYWAGEKADKVTDKPYIWGTVELK